MSNKDNSGFMSCGCILLVLIFNLTLGGWSVNYLLVALGNSPIAFWGAALIGLFVGELSVPVAIVVAILTAFGVL